MDGFFRRVAALPQVSVLSVNPWLLQLDGFVNDSASAWMQTGCGEFETSDRYGYEGFRSSQICHCPMAECGTRPGWADYFERLQSLLLSHAMTGSRPTKRHMPRLGSQVLRYLPGDYYRRHHDFMTDVARHNESRARHYGPRQLTFML